MRLLRYLALALLLAAGLQPHAAAAPLPPRRLPPGGQLAGGYFHNLLLRPDGTLYAWGENSFGQLGNGSTTNSPVPVAVGRGAIPAGVRLTQVAAGYQFSLALASNGLVYAWGFNAVGQLGNGSSTNSPVPVAVSLPAGVRMVQVAAGKYYGLALAADGTAYAWGDNQYGQLGNGTTTSTTTPVAVAPGALPAGTRLVQLSAGQYHSLALAADGLAYAWGQNTFNQLGDNSTTTSSVPVAVATGALPSGTRLTQVAAGTTHSLALTASGTAYAWGDNALGALGDGSTTRRPVPVAVSLPAGVRLAQVAAGQYHSLARAADGTAYSWGYNPYGQLGNGTTTTSNVPVAVTQGALPAGTRLVQVASSSQSFHCLALAADGTAYAWGKNDYSQLGNNSTLNSPVPVAIALPDRAAGYQQVAASQQHSMGLRADGTAYAWGLNRDGQLGNGTTTSSLVPVAVAPGALPTGTRLLQVAAGASHSLALLADGTASTWGNGSNGQLGTGSTTARLTPGPISQGDLPTGARLVQVAAGPHHNLVLTADGAAYSWGYNAQGQLGTGTTTTTLLPTAVLAGALPGTTRLVQVAAGYTYNLVLAADGRAYGWGENPYGQLGTGTTTPSLVPAAVMMPAGVRFVQVAAGLTHSLALAADGTLYAWGLNGDGQLGNGTTNISLAPVAVTMPAGVRFVQVAAGAFYSLALAADGRLYTWGRNWVGQLGLNSTTNSLVPVVEVSGTTQWSGVAAGPIADHSLVLGAGAAIYTSGRNDFGQLGDGTTVNSLVFLRNQAALPVRSPLPGTPGAALALYPNPAPGAATLSSAVPGATVRVLDALGRLAATATTDADGTARFSGLAPGLYLVRVGGTSLRLSVE